MAFSPFVYRFACTAILATVTGLAGFSAAQARTLKVNDWLIVPGKRFGPITARTSEKQLIRIFGRRNVIRKKSQQTGDHQPERVIVVYPGTKNEIEIFWKKAYSRISLITTYGKGGKWRTRRGLRIGSTMASVVRANGKPVGIAGFWWDYGGYGAWNKGRLHRDLIIRLEPSVTLPSKESDKISGERQLKSSDRLVKKAKPLVSKISLSF